MAELQAALCRARDYGGAPGGRLQELKGRCRTAGRLRGPKAAVGGGQRLNLKAAAGDSWEQQWRRELPAWEQQRPDRLRRGWSSLPNG